MTLGDETKGALIPVRSKYGLRRACPEPYPQDICPMISECTSRLNTTKARNPASSVWKYMIMVRPRTRPTRQEINLINLLEDDEARLFLHDHGPSLYRNDATATPYQCPSWLAGWTEYLPSTAAPVILVAEGGATSEPIAALPMARELRANTRPRLRPLGAPHAEYLRAVGPGAHQPTVAEALLRTLESLAQEDDVELSDIPLGSVLGRQLESRPGWWQTTIPCAVLDLPVAYAALSPSTRREHRRRERTWQTLVGEGRRITYRRTRGTAELITAWEGLRDLYQRARGADPGFAEKGTWPALLQRLGSGTAFIATLELDETAVAAQLCLYRNTHCYSLLPAMDPEARDLAPGHALLRILTADLAAQGFTTLDLGRTRDTDGQRGYKAQYNARWSSTLTTGTGQSRDARNRVPVPPVAATTR
ncbi:GNAT family N-acetyltransferase [Streptomyces sp. NPDC057654]|uniref:GNAT family N-acetyltransferase n=1 Tax=Streptomyces sp. NPDC057654 TaxID=3346196 RepID=UPI0036AA534D